MACKKQLDYKKEKSKPFSNLPLVCPWKNKAPFFKPNSINRKPPIKILIQNAEKNKSPKITYVTDANLPKKVDINQNLEETNVKNTIIVNPTDQYQHFIRLMQLFPMTHPAFIHSVLAECNNDFTRTIDRLLRCRVTRTGVYIPRRSTTLSPGANIGINAVAAWHPNNLQPPPLVRLTPTVRRTFAASTTVNTPSTATSTCTSASTSTTSSTSTSTTTTQQNNMLKVETQQLETTQDVFVIDNESAPKTS